MAEPEAVPAARCRSCDADRPEPGNRFCVRCGSPLDDPTLAVTDALTRSRPGVVRWLAAAGAVAVIAAGTWALGRGGAADGAGAGPATTPTTAPATGRSTTTRPPRPTTTEPETTTTRDVVPGDGPVLDRPVGWSLIVGGWNHAGLLRLDLDTGRMERFDTELVPLAAVDGWLAAQDESGSQQQTVLVPLDDPSADGVELGDDTWWGMVEADEATGAFWVPGTEDGTVVWRLIRPADLTPLDRVEVGPLATAAVIWGAGPELATTASGGVHVLGEDGRYRLLAPGHPLVAGRDHILVRRCGSPNDCNLVWLRRDTGAVVDRPTPTDLEWTDQLSPDGRFLVYQDGTTDETGPLSHVFDVERGREVDWFAPQSYARLAISPDGRFLAHDADGTIRLYDVERDVHIDLGSTTETWINGADGRVVVFVPTSSDPSSTDLPSAVVPGRFGDK